MITEIYKNLFDGLAVTPLSETVDGNTSFSIVSERLQNVSISGEYGDWFSSVNRGNKLSFYQFDWANYQRMTFNATIHSWTQSTNWCLGLIGFYLDDINQASFQYYDSGGESVQVTNMYNNAWSSGVTANAGVSYPVDVRIIIKRAGLINNLLEHQIEFWYHNGSEFVLLDSQTLKFLPDKIFSGMKTYSGFPAATTEVDNFYLLGDDVEAVQPREILVDNFDGPGHGFTVDDGANLSVGTPTVSGGQLLVNIDALQDGGWFTSDARDAYRLVKSWVNSAQDRVIVAEVEVASLTESGPEGELILGMGTDEDNWVGVVFGNGSIFTFKVVAGTWSFITSKVLDSLPLTVRFTYNRPTPGNPDGASKMDITVENDEGGFDRVGSSITCDSEFNEFFISPKNYGSPLPSFTAALNSVRILSSDLGEFADIKLDDHFDNATKDNISELSGNGTFDEPAGTMLQFSALNGDNLAWSDGSSRNCKLALFPFTLTNQDKVVYFECEYGSSANMEARVGLYGDDQNAAWFRLWSSFGRASPLSKQSDSTSLRSVNIYEPDNKVRMKFNRNVPGNISGDDSLTYSFFKNGQWSDMANPATLGYTPIGAFISPNEGTLTADESFTIDRISITSSNLGLDEYDPLLQNQFPIQNTQTPDANTDIILEVVDDSRNPTGLDGATTVLYLNDVKIYENEAALGADVITAVQILRGWRYTITPSAPLSLGQQKIRATADDGNGNSVDETYFFDVVSSDAEISLPLSSRKSYTPGIAIIDTLHTDMGGLEGWTPTAIKTVGSAGSERKWFVLQHSDSDAEILIGMGSELTTTRNDCVHADYRSTVDASNITMPFLISYSPEGGFEASFTATNDPSQLAFWTHIISTQAKAKPSRVHQYGSYRASAPAIYFTCFEDKFSDIMCFYVHRLSGYADEFVEVFMCGTSLVREDSIPVSQKSGCGAMIYVRSDNTWNNGNIDLYEMSIWDQDKNRLDTTTLKPFEATALSSSLLDTISSGQPSVVATATCPIIADGKKGEGVPYRYHGSLHKDFVRSVSGGMTLKAEKFGSQSTNKLIQLFDKVGTVWSNDLSDPT